MFNPIADHVAAGLARLVTQYQTDEGFRDLLTAIIGPLNPIETEAGNMNVLRYLGDAPGAQLDLIGRIVGRARTPGLSDADYLLEIYAQIKINTSQGQPEQAIQVFQLFTEVMQVRLFEWFPARVQIKSSYVSPSQTMTDTILDAVNNTLPAGVATEGFLTYDAVVPFSYAGVLSPFAGYGTGKYARLNRYKPKFGYLGADSAIRGYGAANDPLVGGLYA